jgi:hypothetical protein
MDEIFDVVTAIATVIALAISVVFFIAFCMYKYDIEIARANLITIYVAGEKVYSGKTAFIEIDSGGMTTTVKIYKKLFPFPIMQQTYSDRDVRIIPKEARKHGYIIERITVITQKMHLKDLWNKEKNILKQN